MKKYLLLLSCFLYVSLVSGQIYTTTDTDQSITILPDRIMSTLPNSDVKTNVGLGRNALKSITTGSSNVGFGDNALSSLSTGIRNVAFGSFALSKSTTGSSNIAFGNNTLENTTIGSGNVAVGSFALTNNTVLIDNIAIGFKALYSQSNVLASNTAANIAIGHYALYSTNPTASFVGKFNIAIGFSALKDNTTGTYNLAIGYNAATASQEEDSNIIIGNNANATAVESNRNVIIGNGAFNTNAGLGANVGIGYNAGFDYPQNNAVIIENSNSVTPLLAGIAYQKKVGINRNIALSGGNFFLTRTETLQVEGEAFKTTAGGNWIIPSDRRLKKNITPLNSEEILSKILQMKGVTYEMKDSTQKGIQYGFIAQELQEVFPTKVETNTDGYLSADYGSYTAIEIESIKALHEKIAKIEKYNNTLRERIEKLKGAKELISKNLEKIENKK